MVCGWQFLVGSGQWAVGSGQPDNYTLAYLSPPPMNKFLRTLIAGYGAKKLGGGCVSTVVIFLVLYWLLGTCN